MRAVWSFWARPYVRHYRRHWMTERHHLMAWVLSYQCARRHYPDTMLVTDDAGAELLVDELGLTFDHVDRRLETLNADDVDDGWWVLGKLMAYHAQRVPFVHLDADVFLWHPLPGDVTSGAVFAQNPEVFVIEDESLYRLDSFVRGIRSAGGWLPPEWWWFVDQARTSAVCCGIVGGHDTGFLRHYARQAIGVALHPANQRVWPTLGVRDNILVEQYFLAACLEYHAQWEESPYTDIRPRYVFPSSTVAFDPPSAAQRGFTHLIGEAKQNAEVMERVEARVRREHGDHYERCVELASWHDRFADEQRER